jgi:hypothetical protein
MLRPWPDPWQTQTRPHATPVTSQSTGKVFYIKKTPPKTTYKQTNSKNSKNKQTAPKAKKTTPTKPPRAPSNPVVNTQLYLVVKVRVDAVGPGKPSDRGDGEVGAVAQHE